MHLGVEALEDIAEVAYSAVSTLLKQQDGVVRKPWKDMTREYKKKIMSAVQYAANNMMYTPEELHNHWLAQKINKGWRYSPVEDRRWSLSPQIQAYSQLESKLRKQDLLFHNVVRSLIGVH
jgi:hypothetical protein